MDFQIFAKRLKQAREKAKLTQTQFSEKTGIAQGTISAYEQGKAKNPTIDSLIRMANILDVSLDWLVGASDEVKTKAEISGCEFLRSLLERMLHGEISNVKKVDCPSGESGICILFGANLLNGHDHETLDKLNEDISNLLKLQEATRKLGVSEKIANPAIFATVLKISNEYGVYFEDFPF